MAVDNAVSVCVESVILRDRVSVAHPSLPSVLPVSIILVPSVEPVCPRRLRPLVFVMIGQPVLDANSEARAAEKGCGGTDQAADQRAGPNEAGECRSLLRRKDVRLSARMLLHLALPTPLKRCNFVDTPLLNARHSFDDALQLCMIDDRILLHARREYRQPAVLHRELFAHLLHALRHFVVKRRTVRFHHLFFLRDGVRVNEFLPVYHPVTVQINECDQVLAVLLRGVLDADQLHHLPHLSGVDLAATVRVARNEGLFCLEQVLDRVFEQLRLLATPVQDGAAERNEALEVHVLTLRQRKAVLHDTLAFRLAEVVAKVRDFLPLVRAESFIAIEVACDEALLEELQVGQHVEFGVGLVQYIIHRIDLTLESARRDVLPGLR
mmetsp:Transcript_33341/g.77061  ORF Transcript_33341/g.77061 Transcript_33341/m.77061 type:complete len:381 (-) Transcript_33341:418-1560(-)